MLAHKQAANVAGNGVTMNLKFWKKKTANESKTEKTPNMFANIKARIATLTGRIKSPPPFKAEIVEEAKAQSVKVAPTVSEELQSLESASVQRGKLARIGIALISMIRARMLIVGVVLLLLLLAAFGYAAWTITRSAPDNKADVTELIADKKTNEPPLPVVMPASAPPEAASAIPAISEASATSAVSAASAPADATAASAVRVAEPHAVKPASSVAATLPASAVVPIKPAPQGEQTELEALRQKNAELQAQIEALKKAQRSSSASVKLYPGDRRGTPAGGVATVGNSDPKAAATTLKDAIDAMNAGGKLQKQPAR